MSRAQTIAHLAALAAAVAPALGVRGQEAPDSLAALDAIRIEEIRVEGSSVFSPDELAAFTAPYARRMVSVEELHELRHELSRAYVERGYVSSGVIIPDQQVTGGAVTLRAVEGVLASIEVEGNRRLRDRAIARRIERYVGTPVDIDDLQAGLWVLQEEPLVERVDAELLPGEALGESRLRVAITERPAFELELAAANDRSPSVGEHRGTVGLTYRGLVGNGDVLSARLGVTDGVEDDVLAYRVPLNPAGTLLDVQLADQQADIVEEPFDAIDIESELESWSLAASHPFVLSPGRTLLGIAGFEHKRSVSTLLGMPFSFSPGDVDGRAAASAVSLGAEHTRRAGRQAWSARGVFHVGVDAFGATRNVAGPDTRFVTFVGQAQYVRGMAWRDGRLLVHGVAQLARDPLLAMYKMPVGGRYSVRGYRENQFVRDNGAAATVEYQFAARLDETGRARGKLTLALFADYGVAWDEDDRLPTSRKARVASAGVGLLWDPVPGFHLDVYWGEPFDEQDGPTETLQDDGFHYRLSYRRPF
ncbi:MAG TPA: POTRA domain-containing protein [Gammaproteobacteria bacterium]